MGIGVTAGTVGYRLAMGLCVAGGALGHKRLPSPLFGIEGMENGVTLLTIEPVPGAVVLQVAILTGVALPALGDCQRLWRRGVQHRRRRNGYRGNFFTLAGTGKGCLRKKSGDEQLCEAQQVNEQRTSFRDCSCDIQPSPSLEPSHTGS